VALPENFLKHGIKWLVKEIPVSNLTESADNVRVFYDKNELRTLAEDIADQGLLYPLLVHKNGKKHEIIDGHRRFRAIKMIGQPKNIVCLVSEYPLTRDQVARIMIASDELDQKWSRYDISKRCAVMVREKGSISAAAGVMYMTPQQVRFYAAIGSLPARLLQTIIDNNVPYTFAHRVVCFFTTDKLCKRLGMQKEEIITALVNKWINKKIKSISEFSDCIKKVPQLSDEDILHWITGDQSLGVLKALTENLLARGVKVAENVNRSLGQCSHRVRDNDLSIDELRSIQENANMFLKEIKRKMDSLRRRV
jgi:ParB/RepB/Spo0J family partition protein